MSLMILDIYIYVATQMIYVTPRCWRSMLSASNSQSNGSEACRQDQSDLLKFKVSVRMGNKGDLRDFKCGIVTDLSARSDC